MHVVEVTSSIRRSGAWYVTVLSIGVVLERFANYIWYEDPVVKGQAPNIIVTFVYFTVAGVLWLMLESRPPARKLLVAFLAAMAIAWVAHLVLYRYHGDAFNYTALLYIPILALIALKPPSLAEAQTAALGLSWAVSAVLVLTRIFEMLGVLAIKPQPEGIIEFDSERYFLPLNDFLGIDGRWPGPFGHNGDTAMMGALLIVLAFAFWSRASWLFLFVGGLTLVLTNGRASIGAAVAGLVVIAMFSRTTHFRGIPRSLRITIGSIILILGALFMFARPAGLTGREKIWPAFIQLWLESPWVGVGGSGIANGNDIAQAYGHAHSLYIDELARWGLAGFITQFVALGIGVFIAAKAAGFGFPGPLAVMVTYFITGVTEPRNNWIAPSATGFLLILMVLAAAAYTTQKRGTKGGATQLDNVESHKGANQPLTSTSGADDIPGETKRGSSG